VLAHERAVGAIRLPRRHVSIAGDLGDLRRVPLRVGVRQQAERRRTTRVMAHGAAIGQQRRDVFGVSESRGIAESDRLRA
jgi:hypothetical protein